MALLYAHGGGMSLGELVDSADSPLIAEAIIYHNPDWFVVSQRSVRLAWVSEVQVSNNRRSLIGGGAA